MRGWPVFLAVALIAAGCAGSAGAPPRSDPAAATAERQMCIDLKRALFQDPVVRSYAVYARCNEGIVTLTGSVPDFDAKMQAERVALDMPGVRRVRNNLRVMDSDSPIR